MQRIFSLGLGILVLLALAGCGKKAEAPKAAVTAPQPVLKPAPGEVLVAHGSDYDIAVARLRGQTGPLLQAGSYADLGRLAAELRAARTANAEGAWELRGFYEAVAMLSDEAPRTDWEQLETRLKAWVQAEPQSITAHVSLAMFWANYAWRARGSGWAHTVGQEGWRLFEVRLGYAADTLRAAADLAEKCPVYFAAWQRVALGQGWGRADYDELFKDAITSEPGYAGYWTNKVYFLQKRWYGESDDEWLKFITVEADRIGGEEGDIVYARACWYVRSIASYKSFLRDSGADWPRLKRGLEALLVRHPDSLWAKSVLCFFSGQKGDRARCKELFASIGSNVYTDVWDEQRFLADRAWALQP